ncbi:MAG: class I SAM-dependent methyltransferase [Ammonifex sp.]|jgi:predicted O-methyltransferase YrrM|nr:MAG: class I SAM-dependent methyltransferase [Ammonifex sp.]
MIDEKELGGVDTFASGIESYVEIPHETEFLSRFARIARYGMIEVGSWKGRSTVYLGLVARERRCSLVCVDTWADCDIPGQFGVDFFPEFKRNLLSAGLWQYLTVIRKSSAEAAREFRSVVLPEAKYDFLFIDADHSYEAVKQDFAVWMPHLERPAVVIFHDILWPTVGRFYGETLKAPGVVFHEELGNIGAVVLGKVEKKIA